MAAQDTVTKQYVSEAEVFADAFNYLMYGGEQVIRPENLTDMDTTQYALPYDEKGHPEFVQKYRDTLKTLAVKTDSTCTYLVLGIENQSNVHYAMPVRNMLYDAMQYEKQVRELSRVHRRERDTGTHEEYLSGMKKDDRLIPVVTLVINFGGKAWDGPLSLREMYTDQPEQVLAFVPDYRVQLIDPMRMEDEDFARLNSSLREVLAYIRYQHDKQRMEKLLSEDERFTRLERSAAMVINTMTNAGIEMNPNEEVVNMCEAIRQMMDESEMRGEMRGKLYGEKVGEMRGREIGEKTGSAKEKTSIARRMLEMQFPEEQVVSITKLSREEVAKIRQSIVH